MKTKRSLVTLLAVAIVVITSAVEKPKMSIQPLSADQVVVSVLNNNVANMEISVIAKNGDIVYYKQSEKPVASYQKIFDVNNLENGDYVMKLKVNDTNLERDLTVTTKQVFIGESELNYDPFFSFDGNDLKFSYLNFKQEKIKMEIFEEDELVYQAKIGKDFLISSGYDLAKLEAGNYKVVLSSYSNEFVFCIEK